MTFPDDWSSIANPDNVIVSTVEPIFLASDDVVPAGSSLPEVVIPHTQAYTVYVVGTFAAQTLILEWSLSVTIAYSPLLQIFDNLPIQFTAPAMAQISRLSAGILVRVANPGGSDSGNVTIVLR